MKTGLSQDLTDIEVIDRFKQQISWADQTSLLQHGDRTFLKVDKLIYYPVRWDYVIPQELAVLQTYFGREINVLVWGNPTKEQATKLFWLLTIPLFKIPFWAPQDAALRRKQERDNSGLRLVK